MDEMTQARLDRLAAKLHARRCTCTPHCTGATPKDRHDVLDFSKLVQEEAAKLRGG